MPSDQTPNTPAAKDPLDGEISISASLEESSVKLGIKSRMMNALDFLGGRFFQRIGQKQDAKYRLDEALTAAKVQLIEATGRRAVAQVENGDVDASVLLQSVLADQARKTTNTAEILQRTADKLRALPPPDMIETAPEQQQLDGDWLSKFKFYAENATEARVREMWADILTREVIEPKSFSLVTMRILSEMDTYIAEAFNQYAKYVIGNTGIAVGHGPYQGEEYGKLSMLEAAGLITGIGSNGTTTFLLEPGATNIQIKMPGKMVVLSPQINSVVFDGLHLTRAGAELLKIAQIEYDEAAFTKIAMNLTRYGVTSIHYIDPDGNAKQFWPHVDSA